MPPMHTMTPCSTRQSSCPFLRVLLAALVLMACSASAQTQTQPAGGGAAHDNAQDQPEYVLLKTSAGEIVIELDRAHAPLSVANFLAYVDKNFYDGTIFHRVLAGSIIQGGGLTPDLQAKPVEAGIENEWKNGLKHKRGSVAMARTTGDAKSATSQFFINVIDNRAYDQPQPDGAGYAVLGRVIAGMKVVDDIRFVPVSAQAPNHEAVPAKPVMIESVKRISKDDALAKVDADKPKRRRPPQPLPERPPQPRPPQPQPLPAPAPSSETAPAPQPASNEPPAHVLMTTGKGEIVLELDRARAPISTANFLAYVDKGFYDGTIFHRIVRKEGRSMIDVIQGGGFTTDVVQKPTDPPIVNEWRNGLNNVRGSISMARLPQPDSATSQFFINTADNAFLDNPGGGAGYAVFGKVIAGMGTVDAIRNTPTKAAPMPDMPVETIVIESVKRITAEEAKRKADAEKAAGGAAGGDAAAEPSQPRDQPRPAPASQPHG